MVKRQKQKRVGAFGRLVRSHRERLGVTMNRLARFIDMDQGLLSKIERGKRPPPQIVPHVEKIALAFGFGPNSPEFKELAETAHRERKNQKWPSILSLTLGEQGREQGKVVLVREPVVPKGLSGYAPPVIREIIPPDSPAGLQFYPRDSPFPSILSPEEQLLAWAQGFFVSLAVTCCVQNGETYDCDVQLPNGNEYQVRVMPKGSKKG